MTQPHQIDREAVALLPCPFCGAPARTFHFNGTAQATCAGDFTECAGADGYSPVTMWNRRPAPMEAVAWREKALADVIALRKDYPGQTDRFYAEEAVAICRQALALISTHPVQGGVPWRWNRDLSNVPCAETVLFLAAPDEDGMERVWLKDCPNGPDAGAVAWSPLPVQGGEG